MTLNARWLGEEEGEETPFVLGRLYIADDTWLYTGGQWLFVSDATNTYIYAVSPYKSYSDYMYMTLYRAPMKAQSWSNIHYPYSVVLWNYIGQFGQYGRGALSFNLAKTSTGVVYLTGGYSSIAGYGNTGPPGKEHEFSTRTYVMYGSTFVEIGSLPNAYDWRFNHRLVELNGVLYIMGGWSDYDQTEYGIIPKTPRNDVWKSTDNGVTWTLVTSHAGWSGRAYFGAISFNNKIWVISGVSDTSLYGDIWSSPDGLNWTLHGTSPIVGFIPGNQPYWFAGKYYMMEAGQGAPVTLYESTDMVNWTNRGNLNTADGSYPLMIEDTSVRDIWFTTLDNPPYYNSNVVLMGVNGYQPPNTLHQLMYYWTPPL